MTQKKTASTPEMVQPVQDAGAPPVPQYAPQPTAYYPQAATDPGRGKAKWLTFEYLLAMVSTVVSAVLFAQVLGSLFTAWAKVNGATTTTTTSIGGWLADILSINMVTPGTGIVMAGVLATLFAIVALITFGRDSRAIPDRDSYTSSTAYKVVTYGAFGALVIPAIVLTAKLVTVLISSLLFVGAGDAGTVYGALYLGEFVPYLLGLGVIGATLWMLKGIISGRNTSKTMSLILLGATGVVLIAGAITVAVQVHDTGSTYTKTNVQRNIRSTMCDKYGVGCD